jgi:dihydroorotate dehydrogenase electron transfer subunit
MAGGSLEFVIDQRGEIALHRRVAENTYLIGLNCPQITVMAWPGQFVMLRLGSGYDPLLRRPFSICGTKGDLILILYDVVGRGTTILSTMETGDGVSVLGPLGNGFVAGTGDRISLLVAGGIGIAPLLYLAQTMADKQYRLLAGFRTATAIIDATSALGEPMDVSVATDDGTEGHHGPVTDLLEAHLAGKRSRGSALVVSACGPKAMLKKVAAMTLEKGIACQVSLEAHMACGLGACQGCAVRAAAAEERAYYHVCKDGPVFPVQTVDWDRL